MFRRNHVIRGLITFGVNRDGAGAGAAGSSAWSQTGVVNGTHSWSWCLSQTHTKIFRIGIHAVDTKSLLDFPFL